MKVFKVTMASMMTNGATEWEVGKKNSINRALIDSEACLCNCHWFHCYHDLRQVALFHRALHCGWNNVLLFEAEAEGAIRHSIEKDKMGCTELTLTKEIPWPEVDLTSAWLMLVRLYVLACSKDRVCYKEDFYRGCVKWLDEYDAREEKQLTQDDDDLFVDLDKYSNKMYEECISRTAHRIIKVDSFNPSAIIDYLGEGINDLLTDPCHELNKFDLFAFMDQCGFKVLNYKEAE